MNTAIASGLRCAMRVSTGVKSGVLCAAKSVDTIFMPAFSASGRNAAAPPRPKSESSARIATLVNSFFAPRYSVSAAAII